MDKYRIDSHKLFYHIQRVNDWLNNKNIYPIYLEISPAGGCNHRCIYCALDFMEYKSRSLPTVILKKRLTEMAALGVKSIMYAGEGEPLLHKDIKSIINHTKKAGIDVALTTNGVLLDRNITERVLANCTWIKISINAATREAYAKIHRANSKDFDTVIKNTSEAVKIRRARKYKCTLGMQIVLLPENYKEIILLAKKAKDIGMDYLVVKPYSQHPFSKTTKYRDIKYSAYLHLADKLATFNSSTFSVIFRINTMKKWDEGKRNYRRCFALPFWTYIDAGGDVWGCSAYLKDKRFLYGNIHTQTFKEIWQSNKRKNSLKLAEGLLDTKNCRVNCRMDEVNRYLWELKHPSEHVNFI